MIKLPYMPGKLLVGLSGGADSVALMHLLLDAGCQVTAVHVNHGLRGDASDGDEAFAKEICEKLHVLLMTCRAVPPENPSEAWAREARYGFFRQAMAETQADALVLAHHRDDQAETLLLHLLRGTGLTGLAGMAEDMMLDGTRILRPLLRYSREELRAYLMEKGIAWREDESNADIRYLRNALRREVLPVLEQLTPGTAARMANTAALLAQDEAALQTLTADFLAAQPGRALSVVSLREQPVGLQRRIVRAWWAAHAPEMAERALSAAQTASLVSLIEAPVSVRCNLPQGWHGQRGWTHIHLIATDKPTGILEERAIECPKLRIEAFAGESGDGQRRQAIPRAWLNECTVRSRRKGDFIRPFGCKGSQSLQDYFTNRHIDAAFRDEVPLLCRGSEVLLAGGVGAGCIPRAEEINDPVLLRWNDDFPWQHSRE